MNYAHIYYIIYYIILYHYEYNTIKFTYMVFMTLQKKKLLYVFKLFDYLINLINYYYLIVHLINLYFTFIIWYK
jgi:hypothetical protein